MSNFWDRLAKPVMILAPMDEVTDTVFRQMVIKAGKPDVFFTEFTNVDAIDHFAAQDLGSIPALQRLIYTEAERPIVAQIWGTDPEHFRRAAEVVRKLNFDGIDINFGCPEKKVLKLGACGGMIFKDNVQCSMFNAHSHGEQGSGFKIQDSRSKVQEIVAATQEGAGGLPVSVKTRIGNKKIVTEDWIGFLLEQQLAAITIHGRTVAEESKVPAHWDEIGKAVALRNQSQSRTLIIGNGDVKSRKEADEKVKQYGVDGVMIGRGIFADPALFSGQEMNQQEKRELYKEHIHKFAQTWGDKKNFAILKKFMKVYISGYPGATELRVRLAEAGTIAELEKALE